MHMKTQCSIHALRMVQNLSVHRWTLHILNKCYVGDVAEVAVIVWCVFGVIKCYLYCRDCLFAVTKVVKEEEEGVKHKTPFTSSMCNLEQH